MRGWKTLVSCKRVWVASENPVGDEPSDAANEESSHPNGTELSDAAGAEASNPVSRAASSVPPPVAPRGLFPASSGGAPPRARTIEEIYGVPWEGVLPSDVEVIDLEAELIPLATRSSLWSSSSS